MNEFIESLYIYLAFITRLLYNLSIILLLSITSVYMWLTNTIKSTLNCWYAYSIHYPLYTVYCTLYNAHYYIIDTWHQHYIVHWPTYGQAYLLPYEFQSLYTFCEIIRWLAISYVLASIDNKNNHMISMCICFCREREGGRESSIYNPLNPSILYIKYPHSSPYYFTTKSTNPFLSSNINIL